MPAGFPLLAGRPDGISIEQDDRGRWQGWGLRANGQAYEKILPYTAQNTNLNEVLADLQECILHGLVLIDVHAAIPGAMIRLPNGALFPACFMGALREDLWRVLEIGWSDEEFAEILDWSGAWEDWLLRPDIPSGRKKLWGFIRDRWADDVPEGDPDVFPVARERLLDDGYEDRPWP